jgi:hypothetical protein
VSLVFPLAIHKLSWGCSFEFLGDCFLIMSDVVHVDLFCLALMVVTILDMMIFGQTSMATRELKPST